MMTSQPRTYRPGDSAKRCKNSRTETVTPQRRLVTAAAIDLMNLWRADTNTSTRQRFHAGKSFFLKTKFFLDVIVSELVKCSEIPSTTDNQLAKIKRWLRGCQKICGLQVSQKNAEISNERESLRQRDCIGVVTSRDRTSVTAVTTPWRVTIPDDSCPEMKGKFCTWLLHHRRTAVWITATLTGQELEPLWNLEILHTYTMLNYHTL